MLIQLSVLIYPDFNKPFIICTNVSRIRLGTILSQIKENGKEHVIAYDNRSLNQEMGHVKAEEELDKLKKKIETVYT